MKVFFVGAGPGAPDLLTLRAADLLERCSICVFAGSLVNPAILDRLPAGAERHDSARMDLEAIINVYQNAHRRDVDVVRLHSGDPSLYGAVREQMNELDRLRIAYEVVPGVSSFQAAAAALKTELTAPEVSQTVILTRTKGRTPMPPREDLARLAASQSTLCIFLSVARMDEVVAALEPHYGRDCPVGVVYRASWPEEHIVRGTLGDIVPKVHQAGFTKSAMIVVGEALGRDIPASKLYDASFAHEYRNSDD